MLEGVPALARFLEGLRSGVAGVFLRANMRHGFPMMSVPGPSRHIAPPRDLGR
jgi:hypothetical protein